MHKIRYYKLHRMLKDRGIKLEGLRQRIGLLPSDIIKIETERILDPLPLFQICEFLECDVWELLDYFGDEEKDIFYSKRVLESHSYTPKHYTKKKFKSSVYQ